MYTLHHLTTWSLLSDVKACLFMSSHVRTSKLDHGGPTPALPPSLTHWLIRMQSHIPAMLTIIIVSIAGIWHCWPHRDKSRLTTHPKQLNIYILRHVFNVSYHADRSTWSFMKADINIQWQRSEQQNSSLSGCQSQVLLQGAATLRHPHFTSLVDRSSTHTGKCS